MKKLIFSLITLLSFNFSYSHNNDDLTETHKHEMVSSIDKDKSSLNFNNPLIKAKEIDCPDCYGTLKRTYKIEYCVGQRCRTRELYRCNYDSDHEYWVYTD